MIVRLAKYHATGNDFLVWTALDGASLPADHAAALCDRHTGVGADGLITLGPPHAAGSDCSFRLQNADGGDAEMSGNGMRALAAAAAAAGLGTQTRLVVDTVVGVRDVRLRRDAAGAVIGAAVDLGRPTFVAEEIPVVASAAGSDGAGGAEITAELDGVRYAGDAVGMGNPHWVLFVDDVAGAHLAAHGRTLEHDARFPNRTNVEFVRVAGPDRLTMRVWERGVGETRSCGTGATAAAVAAHRRGLVGSSVAVEVPGGVLHVEIGETAVLDGPVVHVFDVELAVPDVAPAADGRRP